MKQNLIEKAFEAYANAYAPYSKFKVGCAILLQNGDYFQGANVENASYGLTCCAERNALYAAYSCGFRKEDLVQMCIVTKANKLTTPCGACRQVITELMSQESEIILTNGKEEMILYVKDLLPYSFNEEDLK